MKVKTAIARLKSATHDISDEYSTDACLEFINTAIQQVASLLIAARYPVLTREIFIKDGDKLPHNYMGACGTYPIRMTNNEAKIIDGSDSVRFRYFATPDLVGEDDDIPFDHEAINAVILRTAILLALNENEYDISQDSNIVESLKQAISTGMS